MFKIKKFKRGCSSGIIISVISVILCAFLFITVTSCGNSKVSSEQLCVQQEFDEYCVDMFSELLASDAFAAHFLVTDPSKYRVEFDDADYVLDNATLEDMQKNVQSYSESMKELKSFDRSMLTQSQQLTYDTLLSYMEIQSAFIGTAAVQNIFAPETGIASNLFTNFDEYPFYDEEDAWQYLSFLKSVYPYMEQCLNATRQQAEMGYFMSDEIADKSIVVCQNHYDNDGAALTASFETKLNEMDLDDSTKNMLLETNAEYIKSFYLPAYQEAADVLAGLKGTGTNTGGLCGSGEIGKQYYGALIKDCTSSRMTPEETADLLDQAIEDLMKTVEKIPGTDYMQAMDYQPNFKDGDEIIQFLLDHIGEDFPAPVTTSYHLENMSEINEATNSGAYYLPCRIDDVDRNNIKINPSLLGTDMLLMYTSIAHESFAGHLYQYTAFREQENTPDIRKALDFLGASEGWAEYASTCAVSYLDVPFNTRQTIYVNTLMPYLLMSRVDVGVNYEGWSKDDVYKYLSQYMDVDSENEDGDVATEFYNTVIGDPGQAIAYAVGHIKMNNMREYAEKELGDNFDVINYHQWINKIGITSFDVYESELMKWIELQK